MKILAIETSCDDTGIAVLEIRNQKPETRNFRVLSNVVASQIELGKKYGGVYPVMAKREHQNNLVPVLIKALKEAKLIKQKSAANFAPAKNTAILKILEREPELAKKLIPFLKKHKKPDIDLIAATNGPGLEPCLWVGVNFAKVLSYFWDIPVVDVNHIKAHIFVNMLGDKKIQELQKKNFPALCLVVSGGHTQLFLMKDFGKYQIIGETRDDAAGECFDKCAKILGLGYTGGPIISKLASKLGGRPTSPQLPRPMLNTKDYDFSFSGLKTAVLYSWQKIKDTYYHSDRINSTYLQLQKEMAVEIQQAIIDVLIKKTIKAAKDFKAKTIILGGGVTANKELRSQFSLAVKNLNKTHGVPPAVELFVPPANLSTDNGLMVAVAGYFRRKKSRKPGSPQFNKLQAEANLRIS